MGEKQLNIQNMQDKNKLPQIPSIILYILYDC